MIEQLPTFKDEEQRNFTNDLLSWKSDRDLLEEIEKDLNDEYKQTREAHFRQLEIQAKAYQKAVETLGFWDLAEVCKFNSFIKKTEVQSLNYHVKF